VRVDDTRKPTGDVHVLYGQVGRGTIGVGDRVRFAVDDERRERIRANHSATHLLHHALKRVLGDHVAQKGSLVAPDRLRFDFAHFSPMTDDEKRRVEDLVNAEIRRNLDSVVEVLPIAEAKQRGAVAMFGEKYGERVRVVTVDGVPEQGIEPSRELCGGTHVRRTGDIGLFLVTEEAAVASGVRRIEALCGQEARARLLGVRGTLAGVMDALQSPSDKVLESVQKLQAEVATLKKASAQASKLGLEAEFAQLAAGATKSPGGRWVVARLASAGDPGTVRDAADRLRGALGRGAAVLAFEHEGKLTFLAAVSDDLVAEKRLRADELVRRVAAVTGGSGGGKPHLALAGGRDVARVEEALAEARRLVREALS
jgi:alanyl-tRNA synthetase